MSTIERDEHRKQFEELLEAYVQARIKSAGNAGGYIPTRDAHQKLRTFVENMLREAFMTEVG